MKAKFVTTILFVVIVPLVTSVELFSSTSIIFAGISSSALYASWDIIACKTFKECEKCTEDYIGPNFSNLKEEMQKNVFGQHIAQELILNSLQAHIRQLHPVKALTMSFHGWTGSGKNFISSYIRDNIYKKGENSTFVHLFVATVHFPDPSRVNEYKDNLRNWIKGNVTQCDRSLFIFDEVDKLPEGLLDAVKPFMDHYERIDKTDYRRSIFIFLSNTGANLIGQKTYDHWYNKAGKREELTYADFEELVNRGAFNEEGGLKHAAMIKNALIDVYVPFLPLEREHVKLCVEREFETQGVIHPTDHQISEVLDSLIYWPKDSKLYSTTGCKRVAQKVSLCLEKQRWL